MDLAHGATILHGDDILTFALVCAAALVTIGGMWLSARRSKRHSVNR